MYILNIVIHNIQYSQVWDEVFWATFVDVVWHGSLWSAKCVLCVQSRSCSRVMQYHTSVSKALYYRYTHHMWLHLSWNLVWVVSHSEAFDSCQTFHDPFSSEWLHMCHDQSLRNYDLAHILEPGLDLCNVTQDVATCCFLCLPLLHIKFELSALRNFQPFWKS